MLCTLLPVGSTGLGVYGATSGEGGMACGVGSLNMEL